MKGMCCFSCFRASKKSWKCWKGKSSKEDGATRKRKWAGFMCGLCGGRTKDEGRLPKDEESSNNKGCMCCFNRSKSTKDAKDEVPTRKRLKCGMGCFICGQPSEDKEPLRREGKDVCGESSKDENPSRTCGKCGKGYCPCDKSFKDEESSENKGESGTGCFDCDKSSKYEELSGKKGKCGMGCFTCGKSSVDEESSGKKGKCGMACFCCGGSRDEENLSQKGGKCGNCFNGNKLSSEDPSREKEEGGMSCFCCCKSSKKEEGLGKVGNKDMNGPDGVPSKRKGARGAGCLRGCLHCCSWRNKNANKPRRKMFCWKRKENGDINHLTSLVKTISFNSGSSKKKSQAEEILRIGNGSIKARVFAYNDLEEATQNFAPQSLLGAGGFGKVYKGQLKSTNQMIAVKKLDRNGYQGNREFLVEVLTLSVLNHENLVNMLGYCAEGDERILVYDYMSNGSLQDHLFDLSPNGKPLDWETRMKIAAGAARGLEHLHDTANPPVICRDLKASNILLDEDYNPRLADYGLAKLSPVGDQNHVSTRVMGTLGYCAPEYALSGKLTTMSDIYSFGVVLLELVTGRKAMDSTRPRNEQRLVDWVKPHFQDRKNFLQLADPLLEGKFPVKALYQALAVAAMCLQEEDTTRPRIKDVLFALQFLAMPEKTTIPNKLPAEPPRETYSTSTDEWQSCSDQEQEEDKPTNQQDGVR